MATWKEVTDAAPELARNARARFEATGLAMLATLRKDGSPRICAIELTFANDDWWFGSMPDARKEADLRRDPRLALHAASVDKEVKEGDAKLTGRAVLVEDEATFEAFVNAVREQNGAAPEGPFPLFRVDVTSVSLLEPAGDHLDISWWSESGGYQQVDRY